MVSSGSRRVSAPIDDRDQVAIVEDPSSLDMGSDLMGTPRTGTRPHSISCCPIPHAIG